MVDSDDAQCATRGKFEWMEMDERLCGCYIICSDPQPVKVRALHEIEMKQKKCSGENMNKIQ